MESATTSAEKTACSTTAATAYATAMGEEVGDLSPAKLKMVRKRAAAESLKDTMTSCSKSATTSAERTACRGTAAKDALAATLGKDSSAVTDVEVNKFIEDAAKDEIAAVMGSCMQSAADATAKAACRTTSGKDALAKTLGVSSSSVALRDVEEDVQSGAR